MSDEMKKNETSNPGEEESPQDILSDFESSTPDLQEVPVENSQLGDSGAGFADAAREKAGVAAEALRRGEFIRSESLDPDADDDDKLIALLSYVTQIFLPLVMPAIILLSASSEKRPFQRYHAAQSLGLAIVALLILGVTSIGGALFWVIPFIGWLMGFLLWCLTPIVWGMAVVAALYYGFQAYQGKRFAIPGLSSFMQDQGWL